MASVVLVSLLFRVLYSPVDVESASQARSDIDNFKPRSGAFVCTVVDCGFHSVGMVYHLYDS